MYYNMDAKVLKKLFHHKCTNIEKMVIHFWAFESKFAPLKFDHLYRSSPYIINGMVCYTEYTTGRHFGYHVYGKYKHEEDRWEECNICNKVIRTN